MPTETIKTTTSNLLTASGWIIMLVGVAGVGLIVYGVVDKNADATAWGAGLLGTAGVGVGRASK